MRLIEILLINETLLESKVDPIKSLLELKLNSTDLKVFDLVDVSVTEAENKKGNFTLFTRVVLEYPEDMKREEVESYAKEVEEEVKHLTSSLLSSENELYASRSSLVNLI